MEQSLDEGWRLVIHARNLSEEYLNNNGIKRWKRAASFEGGIQTEGDQFA